jgi:multidrug efflux pump subunit AcrA (membrane-fusion protein)
MTINKSTFFKSKYAIIIASLLLIVLVFASKDSKSTEVVEEVTNSPRNVALYNIAADQGTAVRTADGSAFIVRSQSGGRVDRVAKVGDKVVAGANVAQIENSAQRAALIQAEGAYDAAVASAGGNVTSQASAKQDAVRTWNNETVGSARVIYNSIDAYFSVSRNSSITGFRGLESFGAAETFNQRRVAIEEILKSWELSASTINEANVVEKLNALGNDLTLIGTFIDDLAALVPRQSIDENYTDTERSEDTTRIGNARASITGSQRQIDAALSAIENSSGSNAAFSNAQVKQALGVLESARAAYGKTIIKTPVSGTVTAVSISVGDIINVGSDVVFVAGDNGTAVEDSVTVTVPLTAVKFTPSKAFVFTVEDGKLVAHEVKSITISGSEGITDIVNDVRGLKEGDVVVTQ